MGIETVVENVIKRLGNVHLVYLVGDIAKGIDSPIIDLLIIGDIDRTYLMSLIEKSEKLIDKKIRYMSFESKEWEKYSAKTLDQNALLIYQKEISK